MEDNDASLLGLSLLGVHHGRAHDEIHRRVFSQATGHHAQGVFTREELVGMEDLTGTEREESKMNNPVSIRADAGSSRRRGNTKGETPSHQRSNAFKRLVPVGINGAAPEKKKKECQVRCVQMRPWQVLLG